MASSLPTLVLAVACFVSLVSPAISQTCSRQNLNSAASFATCMDLPVLDSYLHYTYDPSNSSLSVAFVAAPSQPNGWVAWAINPTGTKMPGSQAFLAYRSDGGRAPVVKTYNISSYASLVEGRLAFEFWNLRAESLSNGSIAIFTTVKVPAGADSVNQVWQKGGSVTNGRPGVHPFTPDHLSSHRVLRLTADAPSSAPAPTGESTTPAPVTGGSTTPAPVTGGSTTPAPVTGGSTTPGEAGGPGNSGSFSTNVNFGVNLGVLVLLGSIFIF